MFLGRWLVIMSNNFRIWRVVFDNFDDFFICNPAITLAAAASASAAMGALILVNEVAAKMIILTSTLIVTADRVRMRLGPRFAEARSW